MIRNRMLSACLCVLLVVSLVLVGGWNVPTAQAEEPSASIKLDFKDFAMQAAQQSWWEDLGASKHEKIKYVGSTAYRQEMAEETALAYGQLQQWLADNANWTINEEASAFSNYWYWKGLYINADPAQAWGICYRPFFHAGDSSSMVLEMTVPEGGAGLYRLEMDIVRENTNSAHYLLNSHPGGGKMNLYVNDVLVYEHYDFGSGNGSALENLGLVELQEGVNTIRLYSALGFGGGTSIYERCSYNLSAMEFIPLQGALIGLDRETEVRLQDSYLPFDAVIDSTYTVESSDETAVRAEFTANGTLLLTGLKETSVQLTVKKDGKSLFTIPVTVSKDTPLAQNKLYYRLGGANMVVLTPGATVSGELTCLTTQLTTLTESVLRRDGTVYFESSDETVAKVAQETGDVTAVGEGSAVVTAYSALGGVTSSASATVTVTDAGALSELFVTYSRSYMGVGQSIDLAVSGKKTSGVRADMSLYAVDWSVDDETLASVSDTGRLTAVKEGSVTVTAAVGDVRGSFTMTIVESSQMPGKDYRYELHHGKSLVLEQGSLEQDSIALNEALTNCDINLSQAHGITVAPCYPGMQVALDFYLPKDGYYTANCFGTTFSWGGLADVYIDDFYMGQMDFNQGRSYSYNAPGPLNTVYLETGIHTIRLQNVRSGYFWWGGFELEQSEAPGEIGLELTAKHTLLVGETTTLTPVFDLANEENFYLKLVEEAPTDYTNFCTLTIGNSKVLQAEGFDLTAVGLGTSTVTLTGEINGKTVTRQMTVTVTDGSVYSAALSAPKTTLKPTEHGVQLTLGAFSTDGSAVQIPADAQITYTCAHTEIASVDQKGFVKITGAEGSAEIKAVITEGIRQIETSVWITVTSGKTAPTLYTYEERANALENVRKYTWARSEKEAAVKKADFVVEHLDAYYDNITHEGLLRNGRVGENGDPEVLMCRYCKTDLGALYNHHPYTVDPINKPWKITCPVCERDFPSNDFESYYKSGLNAQGRFHPELADPQYLVNELYPEMGEGWGVDDGFGYDTGRVYANGVKEVHYYIAYYLANVYYPLNGRGGSYAMTTALGALRDAYLYTGDETYGNAGAILLDRMGDVYPEMNYYKNSVSRDRGKIMDYIVEGGVIQQTFATCADAFWDCFDNPEVVAYLRARHTLKGIATPEEITPETIRAHIDENILLAIQYAIEHGQSHGNTGMSEAAMAYAAVALDRLPETEQMIDWIFRYGEVLNVDTSTGEQRWTGGSVMYNLVNLVDRDGFGNEGAITYNRMWYQNYLKLADALAGYSRVQGADLWQNPKFAEMILAMDKITVLGNCAILTGEAGHMQGQGYYPEISALLELFMNTTDDQPAHDRAARILYTANKRRVDNLHGSIFDKDPESGIRAEILQIVEQQGEFDASESNMLCGHGLAILRSGPEKLLSGQNNDSFSDYWLYFGLNGGSHGAWEALALGVDAYGLSFTGGTGYPTVVNTFSAEREHWMRGTLAHNTVMVNQANQLSIAKNSFPLHFDDADVVKVMDVEAAHAYAETDIYRRTVVTVELEDEHSYAVDFFRVLGGRDHVYSFHAHTMQAPETEGLDLIAQPMGTYAGADVPLGAYYPNPHSSDTASNVNPYGISTAASWLDGVCRDSAPEKSFTIDFAIEDFENRLPTSVGLGMRLTMLSEEPMTEVAIADGHPSANGLNPDYVKYALIHRTGSNDLDTLFTGVIEPYRNTHQIAASELVQVKLLQGEESIADTAAAVKVTRLDGREDYIVYATNPACLYAVCDETGSEKFRFRGFVGVCSYEAGKLIYAYGNEAVQVGELLQEQVPAVTGKVEHFTEGLGDTYTMRVCLDQTINAEELTDRYIYVENDGEENGVYRIYAAEIDGNMAVLDLQTQSLARSYVDGTNMALGFVHNIKAGQTFKIPLSASAEPKIEKFNVTGVNMTLGNELELNIMLPKATVDAYGKDLTVTVIHHEYVDGDTAYTFKMADLPLYGGGRYYKASIRVAAAQMTDLVDVVVTDSEGNVYNNEFTTSVLTYVTNNLDKQAAKVKTLLVDMVNYGAAAQDNFTYRQDLYANSNLTESQKLLATGDVTCTDIRVKGTNYVGSNLSLQDCILLNFMFTGVSDDVLATMTATVEFTGVLGNEVNVTVPAQKLMTRYAGVAVNQIVLADAVTPVTVTLYNADGTVYGYATDSVESYNARQNPNGDNALYTNIMKFAASAYAYKQN